MAEKVLIGLTRSDTTLSGAFIHICQIGKRFASEGYEVVYVVGGKGSVVSQLQSEGFRVESIDSLGREISPIKDFLSLLKLIRIIWKEKPAIRSWHTAKIGALGRIASLFSPGGRSFYVPHGVPFANSSENKGFRKYEIIEKALSFLPTKIICVCLYDYNEYIRIGINESKLLAIRNGMAGLPEPKPQEEGIDRPIRFITAARFEPQKDYVTLAEACEKLVARGLNFELHIYGNGRHEEDVRAAFAGIPEGYVHFKGCVNNFSNILKTFDVFLLSSHWEGLPRSIIEAMACSMPILATEVGGVNELIDDGANGYLVPHKSPDIFANKMASYIEDTQSIHLHGVASYEKYKNNFTLERMLDTYCDVYLKQQYALPAPQ